MATLKEELIALKEGVVEGLTELTEKIAALEAALANRQLNAEEQAALDEVKAVVQTLRDVVPNPPRVIPDAGSNQ